MKTITLSRNGASRTIPTGFSWTTLLFGPIPSAIRNHWKFGYKVVACDVIALAFSAGLFGLDWLFPAWLVLRIAISHIRNENLSRDMMRDGWRHVNLDKGVEINSNTAVAANDDWED